MTGPDELNSSRSLSKQVKTLEQQLVLRRRRIGTVFAGIKRKITTRMASVSALLTAVAVGVTIEQTSRNRGWSLATALNVANAGARLLLSASSSAKNTQP